MSKSFISIFTPQKRTPINFIIKYLNSPNIESELIEEVVK